MSDRYKRLLLTQTILLGCTESCVSVPETSVGVVQAGLASAFGNDAAGNDLDGRYTFPWSSPGFVDVCFVGPDEGDGAGDAPDPQRMLNTQQAIEDTWGSATGLTFRNRGGCPSPVPGEWMSVYLSEAATGGRALGGVGARIEPTPEIQNRRDIQVMIGDWPGTDRRSVAHELGHALGFYHEMERSDAHGPTCDPNIGPGTNPFGHITPYDTASTMIGPCVRTEAHPMSALDQLGGEMMYPKARRGHRLACADGCFLSADGVIVRETGAITIDWVNRGGDVDPLWFVRRRVYQPASGQLAATFLPSEHTRVDMRFPDAYSNPNTGLNIPLSQRHTLLSGGGAAVKSDALYTALALSIDTISL